MLIAKTTIFIGKYKCIEHKWKVGQLFYLFRNTSPAFISRIFKDVKPASVVFINQAEKFDIGKSRRSHTYQQFIYGIEYWILVS